VQPDQLGTRYSDLALIKDTLLLRSNKVSLLSYHVARAFRAHTFPGPPSRARTKNRTESWATRYSDLALINVGPLLGPSITANAL